MVLSAHGTKGGGWLAFTMALFQLKLLFQIYYLGTTLE